MINNQEDVEKLSLGVLSPEISFPNASVEGQEATESGCELCLGSRFLCLSGRGHRFSTRSRISPLHFTMRPGQCGLKCPA